MRNIRNIGIFAHVDAGKTTLSERMLAHCGAIRSLGAVDEGTAHTDQLAVERRRGISVKATCAAMTWRGVRINLIDAPGHADFASEVERAMWALDGAILLLSAFEGVQPQAELLYQALERQRIPFLLFLNKADREGADPRRVLKQARSLLGARAADLADPEDVQALLGEADERALRDYLEGEIYASERQRALLRPLVARGEAHPALFGSALKDQGVPALLDAVVDLLPPPSGEAAGPLCGVVFALAEDRALGRAACVRLFSGALKNRDAVSLPGPRGEAASCKVTQVRDMALEGRGGDVGRLEAGDIGLIYGLAEARVGAVLGSADLLPRSVRPGAFGAPLLQVKVEGADPERKDDLRKALAALSREDPLIQAEDLGGVPHLRAMGAIQLEVLGEELRERFGLTASFGPPNAIYRETIARSAVGFYAYTMPKPCWAVIKFQIDPLPRGSGVRFESVVPVREIPQRYQNQVQQAIPLAVRQGMLGWQVDDVQITLIGGESHQVHTHPLDFIVCTPIAFLDGLRRGGSVLLEPVLELHISAPEAGAGRILSEIVAMRGETVSSRAEGGLIHLLARAPLSTSVDFSLRLAAMTGGRGALSTRLFGYRDCPLAMGRTCPRRGAHPLDTARYILAARSALEGGIFDF